MAGLLVLAGCASDPAPAEQLRLSEQVIAQARAVGAVGEVGELAMAESKLAQARSALADGENRQARLLAEQAELDARVAEAKLLDIKSQEQLDSLNQHIRRLRSQAGGAR
ncbi:DUF4398 domain-containing protein [Azomonas macrocytogenes]|nr:DUF4398 domain-containing protein [Azomonas macrocytogenes]